MTFFDIRKIVETELPTISVTEWSIWLESVLLGDQLSFLLSVFIRNIKYEF